MNKFLFLIVKDSKDGYSSLEVLSGAPIYNNIYDALTALENFRKETALTKHWNYRVIERKVI